MSRSGLSAVWAATVLLGCVFLPSVAVAQDRYAVIVSGVSGGEKYAKQQQEWRRGLTRALETRLEFAGANILVLSEEQTDPRRSTAANVRKALADLGRRLVREDLLLVVLLGHGTLDGPDAKFNLVGPDLTADEWKGLLDGVAGRLVVVNTTASSFPFLKTLSRSGRVVITATDSLDQRFATVFPEYFIQAIADAASDLDKNGRISVWEAFAAASDHVRQHYEQLGRLSTERALLDDNGDGEGREALTPGEDGALARTVYLDPSPGSRSTDPAVVALEHRRVEVEAQLEALKARRATMTEERYQAELQALLVELARITQEIRRRS